MSNNSTSGIVCNNPSWLPSLNYGIVYANYYVLPPIYIIINIIPGVFTAIGFCYLYRKETAYIYQRVYIVHVPFQGVCYVLYFFARRFSGWGVVGVQHWFTSRYYLMWYAARFASPGLNGTNLSSMNLLTSMAFDRFLAIGFPHRYQSINRKRMAIILVTLSYVLGLGASIFDIPRLQLQKTGDDYRLVTDTNYTSLLVVTVFSNFRNGLDMLFATILASLNVATVTLFLRQTKKQKAMTGRNQRQNKRERDKSKLERTLLILTVSQSFLLLVEQPLIVGNFLTAYAGEYAFACYYPFIGPTTEFITQTSHAVTLIQLYIFNRPFTDMLRKIPLLKYLQKNRLSSDDANSSPITQESNLRSPTVVVINSCGFCGRIRRCFFGASKPGSKNAVEDSSAPAASNRINAMNI